METRANYIAVGLFTVLALVVALALVYWYGRLGDANDQLPVNIRIQGSVSGLSSGSVVQFNGISVGRVESMRIDPTDPRFVIVRTRVDAATPIRRDTRATIGVRGLSGGAFISLKGGTPDAPVLLASNTADGTVPTIPGDPAALADLLERVGGIAARAERTLATLENFVNRNDKTVTDTLNNVKTFSDALSENAEGVGTFLKSAGDVAQSLQGLSEKLDGSLTRAEQILAAVDPAKVGQTVNNVEEFTKSLADQRDQVTEIISSANRTAKRVEEFTETLGTSVGKIDGVVARLDEVAQAVEPARVSSLLTNLDEASKRADGLLAAVQPEKVQSLVDDLAATTAQVRAVTQGIEATAISTLIADASRATRSIATAAEAVNGEQISQTLASIDATAKRAERIVAAVDETKISKMVDDLSATTARARQVVDGIDPTTLQVLLKDLSRASQNVATLTAAVDAARVNAAMDNFSKAAEGAQTIVADVGKVTERLGARSGDVDRIFDDATQLTARLNESSKKVDAVIDRVDRLLGAESTNSLVADLRATLAEFRRTARNFNTQVTQVSAGINRFTGRGLANTQTLIRDAGRSINRLDRVIRNLESNPSALISGAGGSRIPESSGRPRR
ncbi:MAG: MlaD family protein [Pseudomonadota bacterium]